VLRRFDQLCYWVREELVERDVILDGEVIALDEQGRQDFRLLMRGAGNLHYAVFDVLLLKGKDLRECPLSRRKRILSRLVRKTSTVLSPLFGVRGRGRDLFAAVERLDLEGIVAKRLADPYAPGTVWRKVRNGAYTQMEGRRELFHPPSEGA
jgi:bifunctional non-homologous end joining protein LigD